MEKASQIRVARKRNSYDVVNAWRYLERLVTNMSASYAQAKMLVYIEEAKDYDGVCDLNVVQKSMLLIADVLDHGNVDHASKRQISTQLRKIKKLLDLMDEHGDKKSK